MRCCRQFPGPSQIGCDPLLEQAWAAAKPLCTSLRLLMAPLCEQDAQSAACHSTDWPSCSQSLGPWPKAGAGAGGITSLNMLGPMEVLTCLVAGCRWRGMWSLFSAASCAMAQQGRPRRQALGCGRDRQTLEAVAGQPPCPAPSRAMRQQTSGRSRRWAGRQASALGFNGAAIPDCRAACWLAGRHARAELCSAVLAEKLSNSASPAGSAQLL